MPPARAHAKAGSHASHLFVTSSSHARVNNGGADRTHLAGHSLGGLAVVALAEKYPTQYDEALPMCTPIGGGTVFVQEFGYAGEVADAGAGTWLTQRSISSYGHRNINALETMSAFNALVTWVNDGPNRVLRGSTGFFGVRGRTW